MMGPVKSLSYGHRPALKSLSPVVAPRVAGVAETVPPVQRKPVSVLVWREMTRVITTVSLLLRSSGLHRWKRPGRALRRHNNEDQVDKGTAPKPVRFEQLVTGITSGSHRSKPC